MGYVPSHWEEIGRIPPQGSPHTDGESTAEGTGWDIDVLTPMVEAMSEAGLQEVKTYIDLHHNTDTEYITIRPIMDLCLAAEQRSRARVSKSWSEKNVLDLEGVRMVDCEVEREERDGEEDR